MTLFTQMEGEVDTVRNVQIIDSARNCMYPVYQFTEEQFAMIFQGEEQDVEFASDLNERMSDDELTKAFEGVWDRPIRKTNANGIHGTLFYGLDYRKQYYPNKSERDVAGPPHLPVSHVGMWEGKISR